MGCSAWARACSWRCARAGARPRRQESRAWALSARRPRRTTSAWPRSIRSRLSQSGRHGGGFRQECARAARAARHGLRLRRGRHADAARAKRQSAARACSARCRTAPSSTGSASTMRGRRRRLHRLQDAAARHGRRQYRRGPRQQGPHRRLRVGHRAHGARSRATSPSTSHRPTRRACAISRRRRRSMRCSSACRSRAPALRRKPPLLVKLAPDLADADLPEVVGVILAHGVDGIVVSNTTLAREGLERRAPSPARAVASRGGRSSPGRRACWRASTSSRKASCR